MPERGGSTAIDGISFQLWFTACKLSELYFDECIQVKPEAVSYEDALTNTTKLVSIDDLHVRTKSGNIFFNIKTSHENWMLKRLEEAKVLEQFKRQFEESPDATLCFVTQMPCALFKEILPRGANCESHNELEIRLKTNNYIDQWNSLQKLYEFNNQQMKSFAARVDFQLCDLDMLKQTVAIRFKERVTNESFSGNCLYELAANKAKMRALISRDILVTFLEEKGIYQKSTFKIENLYQSIINASVCLTSWPSSLKKINHYIGRSEIDNLKNWVTKNVDEEYSLAVVTGNAGVGKTVILSKLTTSLQELNVPVLAIKADAYDNVKSEAELAEQLGLKDTIKNTMAALVDTYGKAVIIFDQIDALSLSVSKDRKCINVYLNAIAKLRRLKNLSIIVSCRRFDLEYDPELRRLENKKIFEVSELSDEDIKNVIEILGLAIKQVPEKLFILLKAPLYLNLFCSVYRPGINLNALNNWHNLYDEFWQEKIESILDKDFRKEVIGLLRFMVQEMDDKKILSVPTTLLDEFIEAKRYLFTEAILLSQKRTISFFHSSFFDYCYARGFLTKNRELFPTIINEHQGLFIRSQVKSVLMYLREASFELYMKELKSFLFGGNVRFHLKLLIIQQLGYLEEPTQEEWELIRKLIEEQNEFVHVVVESVQGEKWLQFFINSGYFMKYLTSGDERLESLITWKLMAMVNCLTPTVLNFLKEFPDIERRSEYLSIILDGLTSWDNPNSIKLFKENLAAIKKVDYRYHGIMKSLLNFDPVLVTEILFVDLEKAVNEISPKVDWDRKKLMDHSGIELFKKLLDENTKQVLTKGLALIRRMTEKTKLDTGVIFYQDSAFSSYGNFESDLYNHWKMYSCLTSKIIEIAETDREEFLLLVNEFSNTTSQTMIGLLMRCYARRPQWYIEESYNLIIREGIIEDAGILLEKIYPYFSNDQKVRVNNLISSINPDWEQKRYRDEGSARGYAKHGLLLAIPELELSKFPELKKEFLELQRKFGKIKRTPRFSGLQSVGSPLPQKAYQAMSFDQFISSFKEYDDSTDWDKSKRDFLKGGIVEHSRAFDEEVSKRPDHFHDFIFTLDEQGVSEKYIAAGLGGLLKAKYDTEKIILLVKRISILEGYSLRRQVISAIEYINESDNLDEGLIEILDGYLSLDEDPDELLWEKEAESGRFYHSGDPLQNGINTLRGAAAHALGVHGYKTLFPEKVFQIIEKRIVDSSMAVRCCLIRFLAGMIKWDRERTFKLFLKLTADRHIKVIKYGLDPMVYLMRKENFSIFEAYLEIVMDTEEDYGDEKLSEVVGEIMMLAYLRNYPNSKVLLEKGLGLKDKMQMGAIKNASRHLVHGDEEISRRAKEIYLRFLNSDSEGISRVYDYSFDHFEEDSFESIYDLVIQYCKSETFRINDCHNFVEYVLKCVVRFPSGCIELMSYYAEREHKVIGYRFNGDKIVRILIESYNRVEDVQSKDKVMDIFDAILKIEGYKHEGEKILAEHDRV